GQLVAPLTNVAVSALSKMQRDSASYRRHLFGALSVMAFIGMGLGANLTIVGHDVIRVLLGPNWDTAGRVFTLFGPRVDIIFVYYAHSWFQLSIGHPERWFLWSIVELVFTAICFVASLPWGPVGMAVAWTFSFWILALPAFAYAGKPVNIGVGPVIGAVWRYVVASIAAGQSTAAIAHAIPVYGPTRNALGPFEHIVINSLIFVSLYVIAVVALHRGFTPLLDVAKLIQEMLPWPARAKAPEPQPVMAVANGDTEI